MIRILDQIDSPLDVKQFTLPEMERMAAEIREELITVLARTGGHLGPNLGAVQLTIALKFLFWGVLTSPVDVA